MTKPLKTLGETLRNQLIKNQLCRALVRPAQATPSIACRTRRAPLTPPGAPDPRHSLPPFPTPCSHLRPSTAQKSARMLIVQCGVGGDWLRLALEGQGADLIAGVRT